MEMQINSQSFAAFLEIKLKFVAKFESDLGCEKHKTDLMFERCSGWGDDDFITHFMCGIP